MTHFQVQFTNLSGPAQDIQPRARHAAGVGGADPLRPEASRPQRLGTLYDIVIHIAPLKETSMDCSLPRQALAFAAALMMAQPVLAAASVDTLVGVVGGAGSANINLGCTTFGAPAEAAFYTFRGPTIPQGGIAACGDSGGISTAVAAAGPLNSQRSLAPVILGNPGYSGYFDGTANAGANFKAISASAHANISGGIPGSNLALFNSAGAAKFTDTLTASSPSAPTNSAGSVRFEFSVTGNLASLGAPAAYFFGDTYAVLDLKLNGGPTYEILNAHATRGSPGTISNGAPPAGWVSGPGSLSGSSTFYSFELPMTWGKPMDLQVGLLAWAYGTADSSLSATIAGVDFFDAGHKAVTVFSLASASGTDYISAVPETSSVALLLAGLGTLVTRRRLLRRPAGRSSCGHPA
jgi:hypothetical protein